MTTHPEQPSDQQGRLGRIVRAVALRVIVFGGVAVAALLLVADMGTILPSISISRPPPLKEATAAEPGWPHRRGPRYDAISDETGLLDSWPKEGPPVLWTAELGRGYSGFIAVGDRVYTQTQSVSAQCVVCLDADTGKQLWRHRYDWPYDPAGTYPGPRATPTFSDGRIYYTGPRGRVGCLRASDGEPLWEVNVKEKFDGWGTDFGYACSPTVEEGMVIMPVGGKGASMVALDADSGATVWAVGDEPASYCAALPIRFQGRRYVVGLLQNALVMHELDTGRLVWQDSYTQGYDEHAAAPLYDEPLLLVARPFRCGADCYRLKADETGATANEVTVESVWHSRDFCNDVASSVLLGGHIYGFHLRDVQSKRQRPSRGKFKCLDPLTGKMLWETDRTGHASVIAADGKLILFNDEGEVVLVRAAADRYEELARAAVFPGERCWTAPALHRGRLYLRSPTRTACLYLGKPEHLDRQQLARAQPVSKVAKPKGIDLAWLVGGEREFVFDLPDATELGRWYAFSLAGVLGTAAAMACAVWLAAGWKWPGGARRAGRIVFWSAVFAGGLLGTPIFNRLYSQFVFTWPVCLFAAHQITLTAIVRASQQPADRRAKWTSSIATLALLLVCLSYYLLCRELGLAVAWVFLLGFLPSWPVALPAAHRLQHEGPPWRDVVWATLSFSVFYWACGVFLLCRAAWS
ncbi:MAG: PQQ-like beta-propeller repeat protein [Candidatus Nealsonbacteria bacterium]|nr:PQQ-like beta-propeller repeat protein [Candidatus Nealsonbacteria bacterium]